MSDTRAEKILTWFRLRSVPGIGNILFKRLITQFSTPENIFSASAAQLTRVEGISSRLASTILRHKQPETASDVLKRAADQGFSVVTFNDENYPALLRKIPDPPPYLYVFGKLAARDMAVAMVGSRNPTRYGLSEAKRLSIDLAGQGIAVVSGMARGIDTAAHIGAIEGGGKTVAVLGSGLERIYPPENKTLFYQIAESGAVISEFALNARPEAHHFPIRNRIISGISLGTVVVEAAKRSGSLITARLALEQNRDVFAVPGSIHSFKSAGTHNLIKQGAKLVENVRDILEEINPYMLDGVAPAEDDGYHENSRTRPPPQLSDEEMRVVKYLEPYPVHIDELVQNLDLEVAALSSLLMKLELDGVVIQHPGKRFSLKSDSQP